MAKQSILLYNMGGFHNPKQTGIKVYDDGVLIAQSATSIDFAGAGVSGSAIGNAVTENISGVPGTQVAGEVPSGDINDVNTVFTLAHTPLSDVAVYVGGSRMTLGVDYTITGATITFTFAPQTGTNILVDYNY